MATITSSPSRKRPLPSMAASILGSPFGNRPHDEPQETGRRSFREALMDRGYVPAPETPEAPAAPDPTIDPELEEELRKKVAGRASTIKTNPKGLLGDAASAVKTLLGS